VDASLISAPKQRLTQSEKARIKAGHIWVSPALKPDVKAAGANGHVFHTEWRIKI